jgi:GT2 family glycosyltransferase
MHVINITKDSLQSLSRLDYPNFELIIVDNNSSDGSRKTIEEYVQSDAFSRLKVKFLKLTSNMGFTGGMNAAYRVISKDTKYVALTHNDLVLKPDCLTKLVGFSETHPKVGAVQGIVVKLGCESLVDSAGFMLNELLDLFPFFKDKPVSLIRNPAPVSYVEGTMPMYAVTAVRNVLHDDSLLFIPEGFTYYLEDVFLSLMLWSGGYACVVLPTVTGEHYRMATSKKIFKSLRLDYYFLRNHIALLYMTNSVDKWRYILKHVRRLIVSNGNLAQRKLILTAVLNGVRMGRQLRKKYGTINLYQAPLVKTPLKARLRF